MQLLTSLVSLLLIGAIVALLLTFGFALFIWFFLVTIILSVCVMLRNAWIRRKYGASPQTQSLQIIEAEYKDVSDE